MKKPNKTPRPPSALEATFMLQLKADGVGGWVREYKFHPVRKWPFDFAWPDVMVAVEIDGAASYWSGAHSTIAGRDRDNEKANTAVLMGWRILRGTGNAVKSGALIEQLHVLLKDAYGWPTHFNCKCTLR